MIRYLRRGIVAVMATVAIGLTPLVGWYFFCSKPQLLNYSGGSHAIYAKDGTLLRLSLSSDEKYRLWTEYSQFSPNLIQATLLYEDRYYWRHPGINPISLARAAMVTYLAGERSIGGSTISMQLARLRYSLRTRSVQGKLLQILRALQLERHYSKKELLEAYLNIAPYGENIEGAGAASLIIFGKEAVKLSPQQAALLAVIPQNPQRRAMRKGVPAEARVAEARLLKLWREVEPNKAVLMQKTVEPQEISYRSQLPSKAPHLVDFLLQNEDLLPRTQTTINPELQELMESAVHQQIEERAEIGIKNAAAILLDYRTMEVRALVGSVDYNNLQIEGQVDGTRGKRSPGSALKPFIYALALDQGLIHSRSMLKDTPVSFASYDPENFDRQYVGPIDATAALIRSRNVPAIQLENKLENDGLWGLLKRAGISGLRDKNFYGLAVALGGVEVTLRELVQLYAMLANGGIFQALNYFSGRKNNGERLQLISPEASFLVTEMLKDNPRPGEDEVDYEERTKDPVAWKTGTSFGFRDAWACGIFNNYVLGVWVGAFDGHGNPAYVGREAAGPLFFKIVDNIRRSRSFDETLIIPPAGVRQVTVCAVSGELPSEHCPTKRQSWFIPGRSPIGTCQLHREVVLDQATGLRACPGAPGEKKVYEFWPSDLLHLFKIAGIPRRTPPLWKPECHLDGGIAPEIVLPQRGVTYQVRMSHLNTNNVAKIGERQVTDEPITFSAVVDADVVTVHWFVNDRLVGKVKPGESFLWNPEPGRFIVRAVDDQGRSDAREINVELTP